jgi:hypothetical protein
MSLTLSVRCSSRRAAAAAQQAPAAPRLLLAAAAAASPPPRHAAAARTGRTRLHAQRARRAAPARQPPPPAPAPPPPATAEAQLLSAAALLTLAAAAALAAAAPADAATWWGGGGGIAGSGLVGGLGSGSGLGGLSSGGGGGGLGLGGLLSGGGSGGGGSATPGGNVSMTDAVSHWFIGITPMLGCARARGACTHMARESATETLTRRLSLSRFCARCVPASLSLRCGPRFLYYRNVVVKQNPAAASLAPQARPTAPTHTPFRSAADARATQRRCSSSCRCTAWPSWPSPSRCGGRSTTDFPVCSRDAVMVS